ncbi:hypothetical protein D3C75_829110 [compost metagenome]
MPIDIVTLHIPLLDKVMSFLILSALHSYTKPINDLHRVIIGVFHESSDFDANVVELLVKYVVNNVAF